VAQLGGISDPTNRACAQGRKLRCGNGLFSCRFPIAVMHNVRPVGHIRPATSRQCGQPYTQQEKRQFQSLHCHQVCNGACLSFHDIWVQSYIFAGINGQGKTNLTCNRHSCLRIQGEAKIFQQGAGPGNFIHFHVLLSKLQNIKASRETISSCIRFDESPLHSFNCSFQEVQLANFM